MRVRFLSQEDPLEKEMTTHSSILIWKIPWAGSLVGYNPWGHKERDMTKHISELELNITPFYSLGAEIHNIKQITWS